MSSKLILLVFVLLLTTFSFAQAADITLAWDYSGTGHDGFMLRYRLEADAVYTDVDFAIPATARQYTHSAAPDERLLYKLTAYNADGESEGAFVWAITDTEPVPPPATPNITTVTVTVATP